MNGQNYVAWNFKAGGAAVANTDGIISTQVSANTTLGFSVITYDGATNATADTSNNSGTYWNVAHGLGATPDLVLVKKTNAAGGWYVGGAALSSTGINGNHLALNDSAAQVGEANILWGGSQTFNATTFGLGAWDVVNRNGDSYVAYNFTSISGYSKVGTYTGTGVAGEAGSLVNVGFLPQFVVVKRTDAVNSWVVSSTLLGYNDIYWNLNSTQFASGTLYGAHYTSSGFFFNTADGSRNASGATYIYMAIA